MKLRLLFASFLLFSLTASCNTPYLGGSRALSYHFNAPANFWEESFPLGNGRIGMMPDGGIMKENIVLNEISLWSGSKQNTDNPAALASLSTIRKLLFEGKNDEAQQLMYSSFICGGLGSGQGHGANVPYGCYQTLGNLEISYHFNNKDSVTNYRRELNLADAIASVRFRRGAVNYYREAFTSFASDLGVIHLSADADKALNFSLTMNRQEHFNIITDGNDIVMYGQLPDGVDSTALKGMRYGARIRVILPKGGNIKADNDYINVHNASEAIILVSMATDYFSHHDPSEEIKKLLANTEKSDYSIMRREHTNVYSKLFKRVNLDLGHSARENLSITERLLQYQKDKNDPSLPVLYFQFGRYLLISSTRPGLLPPNLQGLWANSIQTPWNGDYHLNINLQMNLWPAEVTNLSELQLPLVKWTKDLVQSGEETAKGFYNARGWVTHILGNVWQFTAPGEHPSWGATNTSAAWLCQHLYMHYLFTQDKQYLKSVYPVMKGAALFFVDMLSEDPRTHYLVTAPTTSPENSYKLPNGNKASICAGSTMDNQIIRELFSNTIQAANILNTDTDFVQVLADKRSHLMPTTIGKDGRIMEWLQPYEETDPTHRHVSHLYGLYPGNEISVTETPQLASAAKKTLLVRGDKSTGWSMAWKVNFWARLHDGNHALKLITELLYPCTDKGFNYSNGGGIYPNLFCAHPPFQIDGNFGGCAGIAEMLVQSQANCIEFLPALPDAWKDGSYSGLCVRGGGEVSARWTKNLLRSATLKATANNTFTILLPSNSQNMSIKLNQKPASLPVADGKLTLKMKKGDIITLQF